ncbi:MAG TPA: HlyD family type I secretion periplasmic adaptor subunit [Rhodocyclaceae bacterium]|nr:HlyD family type I secretion periplasmic adaptor subunit [Rhodocyclaceae bacterium]HNH34301.1 HlyD family type I secretion periplasmic adaptor subunit [Rhodocyclaceae bacterium]
MNSVARLRAWLVPPDDVEHAVAIRPIVRAGLIVIFVAFVIGGGWLVLAPLSGAVVAAGFVKVDMNRKTIQHQEGGIVKQILVRDGDRVKQGQTLLVLDDVRSDAGLDLLRSQNDSERARNARLVAERSLSPRLDFPAELANRRQEPRVRDILQREQGLFDARKQTLDSQIALLRTQIRQALEEAAAWSEQVRAEETALRLQRDELVANEGLVAQGFIQRTRILGLQRSVAEYEARLGEHRANLAAARQKATDFELRILQLRNQFSQQAADDLKESTNRLAEVEERLRPSRDAVERQNVVAPVAGEVVDLKVTSVGGVVGPRDAILDIVPDHGKLIVEARIRTEDINNVHLGSEADVRLTAFKYRTTPLVSAKVTYVSADRLVDKSLGAAGAAPYYAVWLDVSPESLKSAGNLEMQAGMPAEVFIRTVERPALLYLLEPITSFLRRAAREP